MAWILILGFGAVFFAAIDLTLAICMAKHIIERQWWGLGIPASCAYGSHQAMRARIRSTKPPKFGL
jgi:hypothetical protein